MESRMEQHDKTVWPPPPSGAVSLAAWFPFRSLDLRVQGENPDFRGGWIGIEPTGVTIHGKRTKRFALWIFIWPLYVIREWLPPRIGGLLFAVLLVYALLLYLFRKSMTLTVPWSQVRQIVLDEEKNRAGIVYDAPDEAGKIKTYSLVFALKAALYPSFVSAAEEYAPERSLDDKLRGESLLPLLVLPLNALIVLLVALLLSWLVRGHH